LLEGLPPACGGVDPNARAVFPGKEREDILFGSCMHGVVADVKEVRRRIHFTAGDLAENRSFVGRHPHKTNLAAIFQPMQAVGELLAYGLVHALEYQVDPLETKLPEPLLHVVFQAPAAEAF